MRKVVSLFVLVLVGIFLCGMGNAFSGLGTEGDPWQLTDCATLNDIGYYLLENDIIAQGDCFIVQGHDINLSLGGHTITTGMGASGLFTGVAIADITGVTVHNGTIEFQGYEYADVGGGININRANDINIYDINFSNNNIDIKLVGSNNVHFSNIRSKYSNNLLKISGSSNNFFDNIYFDNGNVAIVTDESINTFTNTYFSDNANGTTWGTPIDRIYTLGENVTIVFDLNYPDGGVCSSFSHSLNMYPNLSHSETLGDCNISLNFIASKEGLYTIDLDTTIDSNITETGKFSILVGNTTKKVSQTYYMHGSAPTHGQPLDVGGSDSGYYSLSPPVVDEERHCGAWVQIQPDEIYTLFQYITDINLTWNIAMDNNDYAAYSSLKRYSTYSQGGYYSQDVYHYSNPTIANVNYSNLNWIIDYPWQFYFLATELEDSSVFVLSTPTQPSTAIFTYLYSGAELIKFEDTDTDYYDTYLLANYYEDYSAVLVIDSQSELNITVNVSEKNPNITAIYYDNILCEEDSDCEILYINESVANVLISTNGEHTLKFEWGDNSTVEVTEPEEGEVPTSSGGGSRYSLSQETLESGFSRNVGSKFVWKFNAGNEDHTITFNDIYTDSLVFTIASTPRIFTVKLNESVLIDAEEDGVYDLNITYNKYYGRLANVGIKAVSVKYGEDNTQVVDSGETQTEVIVEPENNIDWIVGIIIVALIIIGLVFVNRKRSRAVSRKNRK